MTSCKDEVIAKKLLFWKRNLYWEYKNNLLIVFEIFRQYHLLKSLIYPVTTIKSVRFRCSQLSFITKKTHLFLVCIFLDSPDMLAIIYIYMFRLSKYIFIPYVTLTNENSAIKWLFFFKRVFIMHLVLLPPALVSLPSFILMCKIFFFIPLNNPPLRDFVLLGRLRDITVIPSLPFFFFFPSVLLQRLTNASKTFYKTINIMSNLVSLCLKLCHTFVLITFDRFPQFIPILVLRQL